MKTKQAAPQITDSALRLPSEVPEIPAEVIERFPAMGEWMDNFKRFWNQNQNAMQDFARATLDVTEIAGVLVVDGANASVYVKGTRDRGGYNDPDTPIYFDRAGYFSLKNKLTWDPTTNILTIEGTIFADAGNIGGFEIGEDFIRDEGDSFGLSSVVTGGNDVRFWAGDTFANRDSAPFRVYEDGTMFASMGTIGGWTIGATTLSGTNAVLGSAGTLLLGTGDDVAILDANDATYRLWIGDATAGAATFSVTKTGQLTALSAVLGGTGANGDYVSITSAGLQVGSNTAQAVFYVNNNSGNARMNMRYNGNIVLTANAVDAGGGVSYGIIQLSRSNGTGSVIIDGGSIAIINTATSPLLSLASGGGSLIYDSSGLLDIFGTLDVSGAITGSSATFSGTVSANAFNTTSSIRFKENIRPLIGAMDIVRRLKGVVFDWKTRHQDDDIGFIAEDVAQVLPMMVGRDVDGIPTGVDYGRVTAVLVQALKELEEKINGLGLHGRRS